MLISVSFRIEWILVIARAKMRSQRAVVPKAPEGRYRGPSIVMLRPIDGPPQRIAAVQRQFFGQYRTRSRSAPARASVLRALRSLRKAARSPLRAEARAKQKKTRS
jgi:hypothetical protein